MGDMKPALCFIGFGEAGQAIAAGLREAGAARMAAWDILFPEPKGERLRHAGETIGVALRFLRRGRAARCRHDRHSAVTAAASVAAALSVKPHLAGQPYLLDINSVSPARKQETEKLLGDSARYVDVAVLAPILSGAAPDADASRRTACRGGRAHACRALAMRATIAGADVGAAAAIKMVRSVIVKGIEALTLECFLAAARAGVVDEVANSLKNNYPGLDWSKIVPYNLERMAVHGERRAAEMEEVAETLRELGVEPLMTMATVKRQREMGQVGAQATGARGSRPGPHGDPERDQRGRRDRH